MVHALRALAAPRGGRLEGGVLYREQTSLYMAARRLFGSLAAGASSAGVVVEGASRARREDWTRERVIEAVRERHARGEPLAAHANPGLADAARRLFTSWRAALEAAAVPLPRKGRPSQARRRAATAPVAAAPEPPGPAGTPLELVRLRCAVCGQSPGDLRLHAAQAHGLSPGLYAEQYGPMPDRRALLESAMAGLRAYVARGGEASPSALARAEPAVHEALVRLRPFPDVAAALAYVIGTSGGTSGAGGADDR